MRQVGKVMLLGVLLLFLYKNRLRVLSLVLLLISVKKGFEGSKWLPVMERLLDIKGIKQLNI